LWFLELCKLLYFSYTQGILCFQKCLKELEIKLFLKEPIFLTRNFKDHVRKRILKLRLVLPFLAGAASFNGITAGSFWANVYFLLLLLLSLFGQVMMLEVLAGNIEDEKFIIRGGELKPEILRFVILLVQFLFGLIMTTQAGYYFLKLLGVSVFRIPSILLIVAECIIFAWIYSIDKIDLEINELTGEGFSKFFQNSLSIYGIAALVYALTASILDFVSRISSFLIFSL